jgi:DNA-binding transcriptional regulator YbjK
MSRTAKKSSRRPEPVRTSGQRRRLEIIEAVLRIIAREGLRAVSHRSVATEAGVPLAATTYYFRDLEDLVTESFLHWSVAQRRVVQGFHAATLTALEAVGREGADPRRLLQEVAAAAAAYVLDQARGHPGDRVLEFAFLHEAARLPRLRAVVRARQLEDRRFLEDFHAALGSPEPAIDAEISYSVLIGLEKSVLLADPDSTEAAAVRRVLDHYLESVFAAAGRPS